MGTEVAPSSNNRSSNKYKDSDLSSLEDEGDLDSNFICWPVVCLIGCSLEFSNVVSRGWSSFNDLDVVIVRPRPTSGKTRFWLSTNSFWYEAATDTSSWSILPSEHEGDLVSSFKWEVEGRNCDDVPTGAFFNDSARDRVSDCTPPGITLLDNDIDVDRETGSLSSNRPPISSELSDGII